MRARINKSINKRDTRIRSISRTMMANNKNEWHIERGRGLRTMIRTRDRTTRAMITPLRANKAARTKTNSTFV